MKFEKGKLYFNTYMKKSYEFIGYDKDVIEKRFNISGTSFDHVWFYQLPLIENKTLKDQMCHFSTHYASDDFKEL